MQGGCGGPRRMTKATGGGKAANSNTFAPYSTGMNNCHCDPIPIYIHAGWKTFHQTHHVSHKKANFPDRKRAKEKLRDGKGAALLLVLWLAMSVRTFGQEKQEGGHELKDGDAASKPTERAKKVALVQKFVDGALYSLAKHQTDKAEELLKVAIEYLYHDNTIKDKAAKLEEFMKEAIKFLEQGMIEKSEEMMKGAIVYLESNDEVKDEQSGKRVKYLEYNKVQARVNIVLLVDDFLDEALTYLGAEEIAKAKNVIEGMKLFVSQCDEIKDKAAKFEEMIQRALTFIEQDSLEKAKEVINEAMTYLGNDDDVKELQKAGAGHAKGVKYLEQDKAERGIQKEIFVTEVLKVALTFIDKKQVEQAKEVVEGVVMYVGLDDSVKDKVGSTKEILDGIMTLFQLDRVEKAKEAIQGAMTYLLGDEDVQEADKLLKSMGVEEQNKLVKDVKDKTAAKLKRMKFLENNKVQARVNIVLLVDDFLNEALTYLGAEEIAKAKNVIEGMKLFVSQCDEIKDKVAAFEEMIQLALTFIEQDSLEKAKEVINEAMTYLGNDDDVKELQKADAGHAKGVKYLEQDKAERGIQKAIFVTEVLKVALTYIDKKQVEQAKEVVEGVVLYVALDDTVKDEVGSIKEILDGIMTLFQLDRVEKAKEAIQGAMTYLLGDEDVQEADKLLKSMGVEEQNKLVKDVKDKTAAKLKRVKFLENGDDGVGKLELVHDFVQGALIFLEKSKTEKAKEMIDGAVMCFHQDDTGKDKEAKFEEFMKDALMYLEQENKAQAEETLKRARDHLVTEDAANDKGSEL